MQIQVTRHLTAILGVLPCCAGCVSSALAPALSESQFEQVREVQFPISVAINPYHFPAYSDGLLNSLRRTDLFDRVDHADNLPRPNLVAEVQEAFSGSAVIPLWTFLSLGIIPTVTEEEHGTVFSLHSPQDPDKKKVLVEFRYSGRTILGWIGGILILMPGRTGGDPREHPRYYQGLAYAIVLKSEQIQQLLADARDSTPQ